jgi:hypothetical protein
MTGRAFPTLTDDKLLELLALVEGADSVELKLTVSDSDQRSAVKALGMDPLKAQIRQVYFFDTPELALNRAGVVLRGRRVQGRGDDSVVKLRPVVSSELPPKLRSSPNFVVEVDGMPGGYVCSAAFKESLGSKDIRRVVTGDRPIRKLFSKPQRAFFDAHRPDGVDFEDLRVLGPIFVLKLKFSPKGYDGSFVAELWLYPDGSRILELSTKCAPKEVTQVAAAARAFLLDRGVDLSGKQQTKTKTALEYFAKL